LIGSSFTNISLSQAKINNSLPIPLVAKYSAEQPSFLESIYLPILNYEKELYKMFFAYWSKFLYVQPHLEKVQAEQAAEVKAVTSKRDQAFHQIRQTTSKIFDPKDPDHISRHLTNMKELTSDLDPVNDAKTISAIHFLLDNQHRHSLLDTLFWTKMIKEKELDTAIPMAPDVVQRSSSEKLTTLRKKLATPLPSSTEVAFNL